MPKETDIERHVGDAAISLADSINASCIVSAERDDISGDLEDPFLNIKLNLFKKVNGKNYKRYTYKAKLRKPEHGFTISPKELLLDGISHKLINKGDRVICIQDESLGSGYKAILFIIDIDNLFFNISQTKLTKNVNSEILEKVMDLALEISKHGREGNKVGTMFVIGGKNLKKYTKQMILNPFENVDSDKRNILNPEMKETLSAFSLLDGAFIINTEGIVVSAGTYLDVDTKNVELPAGFGTRHRSAAAITKVTDSIAVVVSETGGKVRVFSNGKVVMNL